MTAYQRAKLGVYKRGSEIKGVTLGPAPPPGPGQLVEVDGVEGEEIVGCEAPQRRHGGWGWGCGDEEGWKVGQSGPKIRKISHPRMHDY